MSRTILVVEDSPEDFEAIRRSFKRSKVANPVVHCETGDEALDYLYQRGAYGPPEKAARPAVVLLDLNLPGVSGHDVLKEMKSNDDFCSIPIVVLTTSSDPRDVGACYELGANTFIQKPLDVQRFFEAMQRLTEYWFEIAILPSPPER